MTDPGIPQGYVWIARSDGSALQIVKVSGPAGDDDLYRTFLARRLDLSNIDDTRARLAEYSRQFRSRRRFCMLWPATFPQISTLSLKHFLAPEGMLRIAL